MPEGWDRPSWGRDAERGSEECGSGGTRSRRLDLPRRDRGARDGVQPAAAIRIDAILFSCLIASSNCFSSSG
jgi:hypothetical protein